MKTFSQFVNTKKDQEIVETILRLNLDPEMVFETAYHIIKSHAKQGCVNEAVLVNNLTESWWTGLKGVAGGVANAAIGRPLGSLAAKVNKGFRNATNAVGQAYNAVAVPAKIKSAIEDLNKFRTRLDNLGIDLGDSRLQVGFDTISQILQTALNDVQQQVQGRALKFGKPPAPENNIQRPRRMSGPVIDAHYNDSGYQQQQPQQQQPQYQQQLQQKQQQKQNYDGGLESFLDSLAKTNQQTDEEREKEVEKELAGSYDSDQLTADDFEYDDKDFDDDDTEKTKNYDARKQK